MDITRYTSIGRPLEPGYRPNKYVAYLLPVIFMAAFIFHLLKYADLFSALLYGLGVAVILFLTWAISREIDPDYDYSAFLAVGIAFLPAFIWENTGFIVLFWTLMVLRVINQSTGLHLKLTDSLFVMFFSAALAYVFDPMYLMFAGLAFLTNAFLPQKNKSHVWFAGIAFLLFLFMLMWRDPKETLFLYHPLTLPVLVTCSVLFIPVIFLTRKLKTKGDYSDTFLNASRIRFTGWFTLFLAAYVTLFQGVNGLVVMLPVWAAIAATSVYRYIILFRQ